MLASIFVVATRRAAYSPPVRPQTIAKMETTKRDVYRHKDLARIIEPKSIAIVGASPNPISAGGITLENMGEYKGKVYPINAKYETLGDYRCYGSLADLPETPDCVISTIGQAGVEPLVLECAKRGVGGVVILAAGYAET